MCYIDGDKPEQCMQKQELNYKLVLNLKYEQIHRQNNEDAKQQPNGFCIFCFIAQGIVTGCVSTSVLHLLLQPLESTTRRHSLYPKRWILRQSFQSVGKGPEKKRKKGCLVSSLFATMTSG